MQQQSFRARRKPSRRSGSGSAARTVGGRRVAAAAACTVERLESRQLLSVSVADPAAGTQAGRNVQLTTLGSDPAGESALTYTWSGPSGVTFSDNGDNSAQNTAATVTAAGTYEFDVVISDGTSSASSSVTVTVSSTLTKLLISGDDNPAMNGAAVENGNSIGLNAFAYDQFDQPMDLPDLSWSAGTGTVTSGGEYTAPASGCASDTVTATADGLSASALIEYGTYVGTVFQDPSGLGIFENQMGVPQVPVELCINVEGDGTAGTVLQSTDADNYGDYAFGPTPTGYGYSCQAVLPVGLAGWSFTTSYFDPIDIFSSQTDNFGVEAPVLAQDCHCQEGAVSAAGGTTGVTVPSVGGPAPQIISTNPLAKQAGGAAAGMGTLSSLPSLTQSGADTVGVADSSVSARWFSSDGSGGYTPKFGVLDSMALVSTPVPTDGMLPPGQGEQYATISAADGSKSLFYTFNPELPAALRGKLISTVDQAGNTTAVTYYPDGTASDANQVETVTTTTTTAGVTGTQVQQCSYLSSGENTGLLSQVLWQESASNVDGGAPVTVQTENLEYYTSADANGAPGQLRTATILDSAGNVVDCACAAQLISA